MANYRMRDARYTSIWVRETPPGVEPKRFTLAPFELVRYNVDSNPSAEPVIQPIGVQFGTKKAVTSQKVYEDVWFVDAVPFHVGREGKHDFGKRENEGETDY